MKTHRHELAKQALQQNKTLQPHKVENHAIENAEPEDKTDNTLVTSQPDDSSITVTQPATLTTAATLQNGTVSSSLRDINQNDLTATNATVLSQTTISEALLEQIPRRKALHPKLCVPYPEHFQYEDHRESTYCGLY
ncbi:Hypothetical predicted protein [Octopus vulgaris]|uniref:Uncharacterized protein n=1 Tax=Octopus vulgaris TaxID=6645 RepID=A0AA36FCW9_OCTVU|nr:Hypothetical predicted protein [Octopus vulgaris]